MDTKVSVPDILQYTSMIAWWKSKSYLLRSIFSEASTFSFL